MIRERLMPVLLRFPSVIVDNFTSEVEREELRRLCEPNGIGFVMLPTNTGFGAAATSGVEFASGMGPSRYLFINPDIDATVDQIESLLRHADSVPAAIVAPQITTPAGGMWFRGGVVDWKLGTARHLHEGEVRPIDWVTGACMVVPVQAWTATGGFAPDLFLYWEDVDLGMRWARLGGALAVTDAVTIVHDVGGTQGGKSLNYTFYNARNRLVVGARSGGIARLLRWAWHVRAYERELIARSGAADSHALAAHHRAARLGALAGLVRGLRSVIVP